MRKITGTGTFIGLDLSLTSTGLAILTSDGLAFTQNIKPPAKMRGPQRLVWIRDRVLSFLDQYAGSFWFLEGYSFGSRNSQSHSIGELGGVVKTALMEQGEQAWIMPPTSLKKFVTGAGNAKKTEIVLRMATRFGHEIPQDDQCDAAGLAYAGAAFMGKLPSLTKFEAEAVAKIEKAYSFVPVRKRTKQTAQA